MWIFLALLSALLTAVTGTLSKIGLEKVGSNFGFAIQSTVVVILAWLVVFSQGGVGKELAKVDNRALLYLLAAGVVSTVGFLCYFGALSLDESSRVQPLDRISLVFAIILAAIFLREKATPQVIFGAGLMAAGAVVITLAGSAQK